MELKKIFERWVEYEEKMNEGREEEGKSFIIVKRKDVVDIGEWMVKIVIIGMIEKRIGIEKRYEKYVIEINWGNEIMEWIFKKIKIIKIFFKGRLEVEKIFELVMLGI